MPFPAEAAEIAEKSPIFPGQLTRTGCGILRLHARAGARWSVAFHFFFDAMGELFDFVGFFHDIDRESILVGFIHVVF
jgi:hypothetical protein